MLAIKSDILYLLGLSINMRRLLRPVIILEWPQNACAQTGRRTLRVWCWLLSSLLGTIDQCQSILLNVGVIYRTVLMRCRRRALAAATAALGGPKTGLFLGERNYVTFALWHGPSFCRLLQPMTETWTFRKYFTPPNSSGTRTVCIEMLAKNSTGF